MMTKLKKFDALKKCIVHWLNKGFLPVDNNMDEILLQISFWENRRGRAPTNLIL
jgi:hypothetical protein